MASNKKYVLEHGVSVGTGPIDVINADGSINSPTITAGDVTVSGTLTAANFSLGDPSFDSGITVTGQSTFRDSTFHHIKLTNDDGSTTFGVIGADTTNPFVVYHPINLTPLFAVQDDGDIAVANMTISDDLSVTNTATIGTTSANPLTVNSTPTFNAPGSLGGNTWTAGGWSNLGSVATVDINGGTIDGTNIGATTPGTGAFSQLIIPSHAGATTEGRISINPTNKTIRIGDGTNIKEIVDRDTAQTLTNKTIVAANNTITTAASGFLTATELNAALAQLQGGIDALGGSAQTIADIVDHMASADDVHGIGVGSDVVGTATTQTLTNKTLGSLKVSSFNTKGIPYVADNLGNINNISISGVTDKFLFTDGNTVSWQSIALSSYLSKVTSTDTPPIGPVPNDVWFNTEIGELFIRYNDGDEDLWVSTFPEKPKVLIDSTPPTNVLIGDLWYNDVDGELYISYDNAGSQTWVTAVPVRSVTLIDGGDDEVVAPPGSWTPGETDFVFGAAGAAGNNFVF